MVCEMSIQERSLNRKSDVRMNASPRMRLRNEFAWVFWDDDSERITFSMPADSTANLYKSRWVFNHSSGTGREGGPLSAANNGTL